MAGKKGSTNDVSLQEGAGFGVFAQSQPWAEQLILDVHAEIDADRVARGLEPYGKWKENQVETKQCECGPDCQAMFNVIASRPGQRFAHGHNPERRFRNMGSEPEQHSASRPAAPKPNNAVSSNTAEMLRIARLDIAACEKLIERFDDEAEACRKKGNAALEAKDIQVERHGKLMTLVLALEALGA